MAVLRLYNNVSENNALPKQLTLLSKRQVEIKPGTSITEPVFILSGNFAPNEFNYCHVDTFDRYYFVKDIVALSNDMWEIHARIDVLESFYNEIMQNQYLVARQEHNNNPMIVDDKIISRVSSEITKKVIGNVGNSITYAITVTGGQD